MRFAVEVGVRWSDMDAYGHVNHARTVTLIEEARSELLFNEMPRRGMGSIDGSIVVSRLTVEYVSPLVYDGEPALVEIWVTDMKAASFVLRYTLSHGQRLIVRAATTMVPYNLARSRPRRLTVAEREYLALWTVEDGAEDGTGAGAADTEDAVSA